ncbi:BnaC05g40940D [Brassica napus]|uniref:(rape) hypothetical protein n=1 Tax=Brassica napus TaxID=3708 RepID=A0A078HUF3_BRANA|nr:vesicle transport v-SNARE 12-like [Brassica napus]CAF1935214.1 unnamed protein product [Brassica napus]CDY42125.1 BnaC05g40940D [Brassica napus]
MRRFSPTEKRRRISLLRLSLAWKKMMLEAISLQQSANLVCLSKLREYKSDLNQLKKDFKRVSSPDANQSTREDLMEPGMADVHAVSGDHGERFAMSMEMLDQSSNIIRESRRLMLETEVGISVVENLSQQRPNPPSRSH